VLWTLAQRYQTWKFGFFLNQLHFLKPNIGTRSVDNGRACAWQVQGPGFYFQHQKEKKKNPNIIDTGMSDDQREF
jgi:hypothetical protein